MRYSASAWGLAEIEFFSCSDFGGTCIERRARPIIPLLAEKFTVIAPDLPGIGDSDILSDRLDMKNAAIRIHGLALLMGVDRARVVGHDIGLMVAYAYAANRTVLGEQMPLGRVNS